MTGCDSCLYYRRSFSNSFKNWCGKTGDLVFSRGDCCDFERAPVVFDLSPVPVPLRVAVAKRAFPLLQKPSGVSGLSRDQVHNVFSAWAKQDPLNVKSFDELVERKKWAKA